MKKAGLFILHDGPFLRECEWLRQRLAQAAPGLPMPGAVAVETLPQLLEALAAEIKQCDLFVVAAEPRQYYGLKTQLLEALGLPVRVSEGVAALQKKYPEDTMFPSGAVLFIPPEARYNGFAMRCGRQHMLVLPLRMDLLESLEAKITQYLHSAAGAKVVPMAPAPRSVDALLAQMSRYETMAPITPDAIIPLAPRRAPQAVREMPRAYSDADKRHSAGRRARRAVAAGMAALIAGAGLFAGTRRLGGAGEGEMNYVRMQAGDSVRLDSALLDNAVLVENSAPAVVSALLDETSAQEAPVLEAPAQEAPVQEVPVQEREAAPAMQAAADALLRINPLDSIFKLGFGDILHQLLGWLIDLLRFIPDRILPPAQVTTTKATTTAKQTASSDKTTSKFATQGMFSISVAGFGHGVGLSQEGTKTLGAQGWGYEKIIKHYYNDPDIAISNDTGRPSYVTHGGVSYELKEYLARIAYAEIGRCGLVADEAIKTQMVCAYTVSKKNGFKTTDSNQKLLGSADWNSNFAKQYHAQMLALASSVLGKYVSYKGQVAETLFFASCAGYTASGKYAWGGNDPAPYLTGGRTSPETISRSYPTFTTDQIKDMVKAYNSKYPGKAITLGADASQWLKVLRTDAYGYVEQLQIGDRTLTGGDARNNFFGALNIRSHNFTVSFTAK